MGAPSYEIAIDSHCGFCKKSAGWLKSLDWRDAIRINPVHEPGMREMRVKDAFGNTLVFYQVKG